jgi:competence protein ComEA
MFGKTLLETMTLALALAGAAGAALAQVDINKAELAELNGVRGIGPSTAKAMLEERKKGNFKDWNDLETRVRGVGERSAMRLSQAGLTVDGKPRPNTPSAAAADKTDKTDKLVKPAAGK